MYIKYNEYIGKRTETRRHILFRSAVVFPFFRVHVVVDHYFPEAPPDVQKPEVHGALGHRQDGRLEILARGLVRAQLVVAIVHPHDREEPQVERLHQAGVVTLLHVLQVPDGGRVAHGRRDVQHVVGAVEQLGAVVTAVRVRGRAVVRDAGDRGRQRALGRVLPRVRADAHGRLVVVLGHALPVLFPALDERAAEPLREREPTAGRGFRLTEAGAAAAAAAAATYDGAVQLAWLADANHGCDDVTRGRTWLSPSDRSRASLYSHAPGSHGRSGSLKKLSDSATAYHRDGVSSRLSHRGLHADRRATVVFTPRFVRSCVLKIRESRESSGRRRRKSLINHNR